MTGPAFIVLLLEALRRLTTFRVPESPTKTLINVMRVTVLVNLFMVLSEVFTAFYTGGLHAASARYLYFGMHGAHGLVPWIWTAVAFNLFGALVLSIPKLTERKPLLHTALVCVFLGVWIEKGMGLIVPGFIPSTLHEIVDYHAVERA